MKQRSPLMAIVCAGFVIRFAGCDQHSTGVEAAKPTGRTAPKLPAAEIYNALRGAALALDREQLGVSAGDGQVVALVADWRLDADLQATIVVVADGAVSMYYNTGGGVIGSGEHDHIRDRGRQVLALAESIVDQIEPVATTLPDTEIGHMRMTLVTDSGLRSVSAHIDSLAMETHDLHRVADGVQELITMISDQNERLQEP
ncbi:MAG: hypothetical protein ACF8LL_07175 [Phycisphaerales bacterium]